MSDIFLCYDIEDQERVRPLVKALTAASWSVFWRGVFHYEPAKRWANEIMIEEEFQSARSLLIAWSKHSIESIWVIQETAEGVRRKLPLFPVSLDEVQPPLGFQSLQTADLSKWDGASAAQSFQSLICDIQSVLGQPAVPEPAPEPPRLKYFVSYAWQDSDFVNELAFELREAGVDLWLGSLEVEMALQNSKGMIAIMSPESVASKDVMTEWRYALDKEKLIIPVLIRRCEIPDWLRRLQYIDLALDAEETAVQGRRKAREESFKAREESFAELLRLLGIEETAVQGRRKAREESFKAEEESFAEHRRLLGIEETAVQGRRKAREEKKGHLFRNIIQDIKTTLGFPSPAENIQPQLDYSIPADQVRTTEAQDAHLWVGTEPQGSAINILNIREEVEQGMNLKAGNYHIEVLAEGFETRREWIVLKAGEEKFINIRLKKIITTEIPESMTPVFISYARKDMEEADKLKKTLESKELSVWIDREDILSGNWKECVIEGLNRSCALIMLLTENSINSDAVKKELSFAAKKNVPIIPVQIGNIEEKLLPDLPDWFNLDYGELHRHILDPNNYEVGVRRLSLAIHKLRKKEQSPTTMPKKAIN